MRAIQDLLVRIWSARGCETRQTGTNLCEPEALLRQGLSRVYQAQQEALHRFPKPVVGGSNPPERRGGVYRPRDRQAARVILDYRQEARDRESGFCQRMRVDSAAWLLH